MESQSTPETTVYPATIEEAVQQGYPMPSALDAESRYPEAFDSRLQDSGVAGDYDRITAVVPCSLHPETAEVDHGVVAIVEQIRRGQHFPVLPAKLQRIQTGDWLRNLRSKARQAKSERQKFETGFPREFVQPDEPSATTQQ